jgi:hypothetical protein
MVVGDKIQLQVWTGSKVLNPKKVSFKSSRTDVATVNKNGVIRARAAGKTKIRVKYGKKAAYLTVQVYDPYVNGGYVYIYSPYAGYVVYDDYDLYEDEYYDYRYSSGRYRRNRYYYDDCYYDDCYYDDCYYDDCYGSGYKTVYVESGYLALRTDAYYDDSNIIGRLYSGDRVQVRGSRVNGYDGRKYVWVYSPKHHKSGYVNAAYLY